MISTIPITSQAVLGRPLACARAMFERLQMAVRVVERDGRPLVVTSDYRHDRVNVTIQEGVVSGVVGIY